MKSIIENGQGVEIDTIPVDVEKCVIEFTNSLINAYKDIKINEDIQETERSRIRAQAKICIAMIEADTYKFEKVLQLISEERQPLIAALCILMTKDILDDGTLSVIKYILDYLKSSSPLELLDHKCSVPLIDK